jgi:hypothetical protein
MKKNYVLMLLLAVSLSGCSSMTSSTDPNDIPALKSGEEAFAQKDYARAEKHLLEASLLADRRSPDSEVQLRIWKTLDTIYAEQHRSLPKTSLERAVKLSRQLKGGDSPTTLFWMDRLAETAYAAGEKEQAEKLRLEILSAQEKLYGKDNPAVMETISKLVQPSCNSGKCAQDAALISRLVELRKKYSGADSGQTIHALSLLARVYDRRGEPAKAEPLYREMVRGAEKEGPAMHTTAINNLAANLDSQGKHHEAEVLWKKALVIEDQNPRTTYNQKLKTLELISASAERQKNWRQAASSYKQFVALSEQYRGKNDPDLVGYRSHYAELAVKAKGN